MFPSPIYQFLTRKQIEAIAGGAAALATIADHCGRDEEKERLVRADAAELCAMIGVSPLKPEKP